MRKLATIREITSVFPIEGKDRIVQYELTGWLVIDAKDKYKAGDRVIFVEPDAWMPNVVAPFLTRPGKEPKVYKGIAGEKLKTIKMGGAISQGLLLEIKEEKYTKCDIGHEVTEDYGIILKEEEDAVSNPNALSTFPSFIPKTDQERVQNINRILEKRDPNEWYQKTEKLEGQSATFYLYGDHYGICSRSQELKQDVESNWKRNSDKFNIEAILRGLGRNLAIQGEQCGPKIEGNIYSFTDVEFFVYDIFDIDAGKYFLPKETEKFCKEHCLNHVPVLGLEVQVNSLPIGDIVSAANGASIIVNVYREGVVYKSLTDERGFSFKAISNEYLTAPKKARVYQPA